MNTRQILITRLWQSPVVWQWGFHALRLGSNVLLLPLLMRMSPADFGFFYVLLSLGTLAPVLDMGLLDAIIRSVGYAMGGATELKAHGVGAAPAGNGGPNFVLLRELLRTTQFLFRGLSLLVLIGLGAWGTYQVSLSVGETSSPSATWLAWGLTLVGGVFEMYAGWWTVYLRGINQVLLSSRIAVLAFLLKFLLSCGLLLAGLGLLSVPLATFVSTFVQRRLSRRHVLRFLNQYPATPTPRSRPLELLRILWPNSWRLGLHLSGVMATANIMTFLCQKEKGLGLAVIGQYGLSLQLANLCLVLAFTWISVKWPLIFQMRARQDVTGLRTLMRQRTWLCIATYVVLACGAGAVGENLVHWLNPQKTLLPQPWVVLLLASGFFGLQFNVWGTFILTENRVPYLWPTLLTNAASVALTVVLLRTTAIGSGALVLAPCLAWAAFNYWYWPQYAARTLQTTLARLLFGGVQKQSRTDLA